MELFAIIISGFLGLILLAINILFWRKLKGVQAIMDDPDHRATKSLVIKKISGQYDRLDKEINDLYEIHGNASKVTKRGLCKVGTNRFNALGEKGSGQSFALALLNFKDSGIIISTIQTSQGNRIFIRDIKDGKSEGSPLPKEESIALERAKQVVF